MQVFGIPSAQNIFEARYPVVEAIAFVTIVGTLSEFAELRGAGTFGIFAYSRCKKKKTQMRIRKEINRCDSGKGIGFYKNKKNFTFKNPSY